MTQPDQNIDTAAMRIIIADDNAANIALLHELLEGAGYGCVTCVQNPMELVQLVQANPPDLLLLDLHMPMLSGFEVMAELRPLLKHPHYLPILVVTADATVPTKRRALSFGARDFVTKPIDATEVLLRVRNLLQTRRLQTDLSGLVDERTRELDAARAETLSCVMRAAGHSDDRATRRIERAAHQLALRLGIDDAEARAIGQAAPLHCLGPDVFADCQSSVLVRAAEVVRYHGAHWDGNGNPRGVVAEQIPQAARIAAVAIAFDAAAHGDGAVAPLAPARAVERVREAAGTRFDPDVVRALAQLDAEALTDHLLSRAA